MFGDFHRLELSDGAVNIVYSNSLHNSIYLTHVLAKAGRLMTNKGLLVIETDRGVEDENGPAPDLWASFQWSTVSVLSDRVVEQGFQLISRSKLEYSRAGTCLEFRNPHKPSRE